MSEFTENKGLCLTCINSADCKFLHNHHDTIWQCEEYDGAIIPQSNNNLFKKIDNARSDTDTYDSQQIKEMDDTEYSGLCINCENRQTCNTEKIEGGIWHCENYQ